MNTHLAKTALALLVVSIGAGACGSADSMSSVGSTITTAAPDEQAGAVSDQALATIDELVADAGIPGLAWAVVDTDGRITSGATGWSDVESSTPADATTPYLQASVSKPVLSTVVMALVDAGELDLDVAVSDYVGFAVENPLVPEGMITLRSLLTHTSGIIDNGEVYDALYTFEGDSDVELGDYLEAYLVDGGRYYDPIQNFSPSPPGAQYHYSNTGAGLVGLVIERATGRSLNEVSHDVLFEPLEMKNSEWRLGAFGDDAAVAQPYTADTGGFAQIGHLGHPSWPDGGLRASPEDLAAWLRALNHPTGTTVVSPDTIDAMIENGFFWELDGDIAWHNGLDHGAATLIMIHRPTGAALSIATNTDQLVTQDLLREVAATLFEDLGVDLDGNASDDGGNTSTTALLEAAAADLPGDIAIAVAENGGDPEVVASGDGALEAGIVPSPGITTLSLSLAALSLQDSGVLPGLAVPVHELLGDDPLADDISPNVRLTDLLTHTSGLPKAPANQGPDVAPRELLESVDLASTSSQPGSVFEFNHTNNLLAGVVLEAVTGEPLERVLVRFVFEPAALDSARLLNDDPDGLIDGFLAGPADGAVSTADYGPGMSWNGTVAMNALDMVRLQQALAQGEVAPADRVDRLRSPATGDLYGMGVQDVTSEFGLPVSSVPGDAPGYQSLLIHTLDGSIVVAIVANDEFIDIEAVAEEVLS